MNMIENMMVVEVGRGRAILETHCVWESWNFMTGHTSHRNPFVTNLVPEIDWWL